MTLVFLVAGAAVVFVIAAVLIGRESARLAGQAPRPVFDLDEAVGWIADRLPEEVSARLSYGEVRTILDWTLERLPADDDALLIHVVDRSVAAGHDWTIAEVSAVLALEADYLTVIGAAGPVSSEPPEKGGGPAEDRQ